MPLPSWGQATGAPTRIWHSAITTPSAATGCTLRSLEQVDEENGVRYDGKRIRLKPFLMISTSRDGKKTNTITSDVAIIDLNQPLGFIAGPDEEPLKVKHVHLEPNVLVRDNKGTPDDRNDDMKVASRTLEYDEPPNKSQPNRMS